MHHKDDNNLMKKVLLGEASEQDMEQLRQHADSETIEEILEADDLARRYQYYAEADYRQALDRSLAKMKGERRGARTIALRRRLAAAAAVAVLVAGGLFWYWHSSRVIPPVVSEQVLAAMQQSKLAGRQEAIIEHTAPTLHPSPITHHPSHAANEAPSGAVGQALAALAEASCVTTRSDKEFWLTLPDGSLVHLNYNTRVIYPERFVGDSRDVYLEGEAYFMVAKDRRHPFIVHTEQGEARVYGTEFNVCTRTEQTEVVLVEGSVGVTPTGGSEQMMMPGQMATLDAHGSTLGTVDVEPYVAWNTGEFVFTDEPIGHIMEVLGRWYGRTVVYASDELRAERFSGSFSRYNDEDATLQAIEAVTGLHIERKANLYTIY